MNVEKPSPSAAVPQASVINLAKCRTGTLSYPFSINLESDIPLMRRDAP
jgi:hypothetical protein